ncbi:uncharacterized protein LOC121386475 [Gigantopelta aegis]|uniref:uncharacterized protein LOC121386475 n=1 Tax=Gigantopelta aegis TaxID=1735272 RepID=UPI001B88BB7E|nr:uncharacterized protein LOC121386475 [Gigantopelta aegis]
MLLELTADPTTAILKEKVKLACTVHDANGLFAEVMFVKVSGQTDVTVGSVIQYIDSCGDVRGTRGYRPYCGRFTTSNVSEVKFYLLEIESVKDDDYTDWWCQTKVVGADHDIFTLKRTERTSFRASSGSRANQLGMRLFGFLIFGSIFGFWSTVQFIHDTFHK